MRTLSALFRLCPKRVQAHSRVRGFTLIEILVAMTILMIIVLLVAGIFQQTSLAWSLGLRRADAQSVTRAVIGAINRDLAMMVDPANFVVYPAKADDSSRESAYQEGLDASSGKLTGSLDFWILKPADLSTSKLADSNIASRELVHVTYSGGSSISRKEEQFRAGSSTPSSTASTTYDLGNGSISFSDASIFSSGSTYTSFYDVPGIEIKVKPHTPVSVNDYEIVAGSCGPDGKWGTEDDIRPWVEGEDNE